MILTSNIILNDSVNTETYNTEHSFNRECILEATKCQEKFLWVVGRLDRIQMETIQRVKIFQGVRSWRNLREIRALYMNKQDLNDLCTCMIFVFQDVLGMSSLLVVFSRRFSREKCPTLTVASFFLSALFH